ncbi:MAG: hypothetical protein COT17_08250 [Elusimicrobia bacterium CG08_land_8_20_14_0_20_51_18]|nr:MAG: hypothetical protein COT17_08250 [Elusimicrobia bacterium CG08_land_8_20_14_0_20_51_18]
MRFFSSLFIASVITGFPLSAEDTCGGPLARSQIESFSLNLSTSVPAEKKYALLEKLSSSRLEQLKLLLEPFSESEKKLIARVKKRPPYLVTRVKADKLRSIFSGGALLSPDQAAQTGAVKEGVFTPLLEDRLFGGYNCVFASFGPYEGRVRYGEVVLHIDLKKAENKLWATLSSGWHFMKNNRPSGAKNDAEPSSDDIAAFAATVFTGPDVKEAFALIMTVFLRGRPAEERAGLIERLLAAETGPAFYSLVDAERLGYFEAKVDGRIGLESVESIEVPASEFEEIISWPEASKYKSKIYKY